MPSSPFVRDDHPNQMRVPKTAELVAGRIRRRIVRGELAEGEALPSESSLMEDFAISRPTLREAFRVLESEGLITIRRGARGGARVQVPDGEVAARYAGLILQYRQTNLSDVFEARAIVEAPAARMVADRRDRAAAVIELEAALEAQGSDPDSPQHPLNFHRLVVRLTGNETLILITDMLEQISEAPGTAVRTKVDADELARQERRGRRAHAKLIELIRSGDGVEAEAFWRRHLTEVGKYLMKAEGGGTAVVNLLD